MTVALALLPPLGGLLADTAGWRASFAPFWLVLVLAIVAVWVVPVHDPIPGGLRHVFGVGRRLLRWPDIRYAVWAGVAGFIMMYAGFQTLVPIHLAQVYEAGAGARGLIMGVAALGSFATSLRRGYVRATPPSLVGAGFGVLALCFTMFAFPVPLVALAVGSLLFGIAQGLLIPSMQTMAASPGDGKDRSIAVSTWVAGVRGGQACGPFLASGLLQLGTTVQVFAVLAMTTFGIGGLAVRNRPSTTPMLQEDVGAESGNGGYP